MTRADALKIWLPVIKMGVESMQECSEALDMAIKALEQEPKLRQALEMEKGAYNALVKDLQCSDCISRQAAIDAIWDGTNMDIYTREVKEYLENLPPVTPTEKVGKWIDDNKDEIDAQYGRHLYRCQICNKYAEYFVGGTEDWWDIEKPNYCPSCGAKMQEGEE